MFGVGYNTAYKNYLQTLTVRPGFSDYQGTHNPTRTWECASSTQIFSVGSKGKGKAVPVLFLTEHHDMKAYWGVDV
jgi:hypothetical protein